MSLPPAVRRYLDAVLPPGQAAPARVRLAQHGILRASTSSSRWMSFTATHEAWPLAHSFAWNARVRAARFVQLRVRDSLRQGRGAGEVRWLGCRLSHDEDNAEMNAGSLHRFLAEAVWYPWALLPHEHLRWEPRDDARAVATLEVEGTAVSLEFRFGGDGLVSGIFTPARWGRFAGGYALEPWQGGFGDYRRLGGLLVPTQAQVGWYAQGRLEIVWRGVIDDLEAAA